MARQDYEVPARRPLRIFALDPMVARGGANRVTLEVRNELLLPGPQGDRVQVIDYDTARKVFYPPVDLDNPRVLMNQGLDPSESNPHFHQQMVYAVTMKVIENFEQALGRRITFKGRKRLRLLPHAFQGANAFYHPKHVAIFFGYFPADQQNPGPNLPGQTIFTCLSHDIVAHEVTHALIDRLRPHFLEQTNADVSAFHEGFADIVAIFQHFSFPQIVAEAIQTTRGDLRSPNLLGGLAQQFGFATGSGEALRAATEARGADPQLYLTVFEAHERGSILVAAVFDAFFRVYQSRIKDLVRIATGGTGKLPEGDLHPDLVARIAGEASKAARTILRICIRALEYLPPVDVTFGDFLRALVTADFEAVPEDSGGIRAALIEAFRSRGIRLDGVASLAEGSLIWPDVENAGYALPMALFDDALNVSARMFDRGPRRKTRVTLPDDGPDAESRWAGKLIDFAKANPDLLGFDPAFDPDLTGFHTVFRMSPEGQLVVELVAQFTQEDKSAREDPAYGGAKVMGGATIIVSAHGKVRYVIKRPIAEVRKRALAFVAESDSRDMSMSFPR